MRTRTENLQPTRSASKANVTPTKQAINHLNTPAVWRPYFRGEMKRAKFSEEPDFYLVAFRGTECGEPCDIEAVVEAYHPYMALGQVVGEFSERIRTSIENVRVYRRIVKPATTATKRTDYGTDE